MDLVTLKALLSVPLTEIRYADYLFCRMPDCPIVYFSASAEQVFSESALRDMVYQKPSGDEGVFVCYCFRHTAGSVKAERVESAGGDAVQAVTAGIQRGLCACEIRNPQGSCCLGNRTGVTAESVTQRKN